MTVCRIAAGGLEMRMSGACLAVEQRLGDPGLLCRPRAAAAPCHLPSCIPVQRKCAMCSPARPARWSGLSHGQKCLVSLQPAQRLFYRSLAIHLPRCLRLLAPVAAVRGAPRLRCTGRCCLRAASLSVWGQGAVLCPAPGKASSGCAGVLAWRFFL